MAAVIVSDYFYGEESEQFSYFRIPRLLVRSKKFKTLDEIQTDLMCGHNKAVRQKFTSKNSPRSMCRRFPFPQHTDFLLRTRRTDDRCHAGGAAANNCELCRDCVRHDFVFHTVLPRKKGRQMAPLFVNSG